MGILNKVPGYEKLFSQFPGMSSDLGKSLGYDKPQGPEYWYDQAKANATSQKMNYGDNTNQDWLNRFGGRYSGEADWFSKQNLAGQSQAVGVNYGLALRQANTPASLQAFSNLMNLLSSQGRTDPRLMNQQMAGIQRDTQGGQQQMQGNLQSRGFQNSGVGAALMAALGQGGAGKQADIRANEAQKAEERRRSDLGIFQQLIGQPSENAQALAMGQYSADRTAKNQEDQQKAQGVGSLMQAFAQMFGGK